MKTFFILIFFCFTSFLFGQQVYNIFYGVGLVEASSGLSDSSGDYPAANLVDISWRSWAEGAAGSGIGEYFTFGRSYNGYGEYPAWINTSSLEEFIIAGFALKNGYGNPDFYGKNNRVKSFKIYADGTYIETVSVKDSISFEQYSFETPITCKKLRFVIDSVYPGTDYDDTCIEEIALLSEIVSDDIFYKSILFRIGGPGFDGPGYVMYRSYKDGVYVYNYETGEGRLIDNNVPYVKEIDEDELLLRNYLPFLPAELQGSNEYASNIARLDAPASLRLTENLPRLDGATAIYPLYSAFVHAVYPEDTQLKEHEYGLRYSLAGWNYFPQRGLLYEYGLGSPEISSIVQCNKTPNAYQRLIDGETDIVFCYEPSEAEIAAAAEKGLRFNLTPIAKDAFVFIVNERNPLAAISTEQIRNIYSGRITNWKTITGVDEPVIAYQRPENSGSQTVLQSIMTGEEIMRPILDGKYVSSGMFGMIERIASRYYNYNAAIGYTFRFYLNAMAGNSGTKVLAVNGVTPNLQNVQSGAYPFSQTVFAVTTGNESENTQKFIEWITSSQGQELVEKTGYVPIR